MFYEVNKFHIVDRPTRRESSKHVEAITMPVRWWRAIGDSTLRLISHFTVRDRLGVVRGTYPETLICFTQVKEDDDVIRKLKAQYITLSQPYVADAVKQIEEDGLFVRGIERLLLPREILGITQVDWPERSEEDLLRLARDAGFRFPTGC